MQNTFTGQNLLAIILILLGAGFMLDQLNLLDFSYYLSQWWPVVIIAFGFMEFIKQGRHGLIPILIMAVGTVLLLSRLTGADINLWALFWPSILIIIGASMIFRTPPAAASTEDSLNITTIFSGTSKQLASKAFTGGAITTLFGGSDLNFSQAKLAKDARLDVMVAFGGVEIKVPENYRIINKTTAILGGVEDKTSAPADTDQVLTITGTILFGGLEIKSVK